MRSVSRCKQKFNRESWAIQQLQVWFWSFISFGQLVDLRESRRPKKVRKLSVMPEEEKDLSPKSLCAVMGRYDVEQSSSVILLMEEILHHMGCIKPCKYWDIYHINRCRISSINSRKRFDLTWFKVEGSMVKHLLGHQLRTNWQRWNSQGVRTSAYWFRNSECNLAAEVHVFGSRTLKVVILLSGPCGKCRPRPSDHPLFKITTYFVWSAFLCQFISFLFVPVFSNFDFMFPIVN